MKAIPKLVAKYPIEITGSTDNETRIKAIQEIKYLNV